MKKSKRFQAIAACVVLAAGLFSAAGGVQARAAQERVYQEKYDTVFEDFDREDISDAVSFSGNVQDSGKSYLEVAYGEKTTSPDDAIYKQAVPGDAGRGNLVIIMRSPDGSASIDDIILGTRYNDSFPVYGKALSELGDANLDPLPELTGEYQKYIINFSNSYEDDEVYEGSDVQVNSGVMVGFHLYSKEGTSGTLEISHIYFTTDDSDNTAASRTMLNHFMGGETVDVTANASTSTWWCGSATGVIRRRSITLEKDASMEVVHTDRAAGDYKYAVIEGEGDMEHMLVAAHNGSFSEYQVYEGAVAVEGATDGFAIKAGGDAVTIRRIFYTNFEDDVVALAMPYIDPESVQLFDHFNVSQTGMNGDYDEMSTRPEVAASNLYYRLSYNNGDKVAVENGALVFDAAALAENDYINFKTESMAVCEDCDYIVLKVKAEDGASLDGFRFGIGGAIVWGNGGLLSGTGLPVASLDDTEYVYRTADGYSYIIVDVDESGLERPEAGISMMDMYYSGTGRLLIDEIFFAKQLAVQLNTVSVCQEEEVTYDPVDEGYQWLGYVSAVNEQAAPYLVLCMAGTEGASLDSVRLEFRDLDDQVLGVRWFSQNDEGSLAGTDGMLLPALSTAETDYVIDLEKSGIGTNVAAFHIHSGGSAVGGQITLKQVRYASAGGASYDSIMASLPTYEAPDMEAPVVTLEVPTTAAAGDTITVAVSATDDSGDVTLTVSVVKDGAEVTLGADNTFTAEEGVYTITAVARDAAENESSKVVQLTVTAPQATETPEATEAPEPTSAGTPTQSVAADNQNKNDKGSNAAVIVIVVVVVAAAAAAGVTVAVKKKKK